MKKLSRLVELVSSHFFDKIVQHRCFSGEDFGHHLPNIKTFRASNVLSNTVFGVEGIVLTRR